MGLAQAGSETVPAEGVTVGFFPVGPSRIELLEPIGDEGPVQKFTCSETSDGKSDVIFLHPAGRFLSKLKAAKSVTVEAEFYQEGTRQFNFTSRGVKWEGRS